MRFGFTKIKIDSNHYFKVEDGRPVIILLYVNDLFLTVEEEIITDTERRLDIEFKMKDLGMMHYLLGMEVWHSADGILVGQGKYTMDILKRFRMMEFKEMATSMASNLKLLSDVSSEKVNATIYY